MVAERVSDRPRLTLAPGPRLVEADELERLMGCINASADERRCFLLHAAPLWGLTNRQREQLWGLDGRLERLWRDKRQLLAMRERASRRRSFRLDVERELAG